MAAQKRDAEPYYRLAVNLPLDLYERLKAAADAGGETISDLVRRAIDAEIQRMTQRT